MSPLASIFPKSLSLCSQLVSQKIELIGACELNLCSVSEALLKPNLLGIKVLSLSFPSLSGILSTEVRNSPSKKGQTLMVKKSNEEHRAPGPKGCVHVLSQVLRDLLDREPVALR